MAKTNTTPLTELTEFTGAALLAQQGRWALLPVIVVLKYIYIHIHTVNIFIAVEACICRMCAHFLNFLIPSARNQTL